MDPNQNQQPVAPTPPPSTQGGQTIIIPTPKSSTNKLLIGVAIIIFLVIIGIGSYIFISQQSSQSSQQTEQTTQAVAPTIIPTVAKTAEERETELIDVGTLDSDFADIDNDLQSL